jgi:glycosyltransferase involved in cell wall biosynthesis
MSRPLVTIGITAFNAVDSLERAVTSALNQTWRPLEIMIVDDCSSDQTPTMMERLALQHREVRIFHNPVNGGVAVTRNHILQKARGEFLAFFDDDDVSLPQRVEMQLERITRYEKEFARDKPVICHTARRLIYEEGSQRIVPTMGQHLGCVAPHGNHVVRRILLGSPLPDGLGECATCSQMARLETYRQLGGFDSSLRRTEDTDFNIRLAQAGGHFVGLAQPLVDQYMTKTFDKSLADEHHYNIILLAKHKNLLKNPAQYEFCSDWIEMKFAWLKGTRGKSLLRLAKLMIRHPVRTLRRLVWSMPNLGRNQAFSRFHANPGG